MDKIKIRIDKEDIELLEFMPTFYKVAEITNPLLEKMKQGMKTWTSEEIYKKMQVSVWVVNDTRVFFARPFCIKLQKLFVGRCSCIL